MPPPLSPDQQAAWAAAAALLARAGLDLDAPAAEEADPDREGEVLAITGRAGSGKSLLLAALCEALRAAGVQPVQPDWAGRRARGRSVAVLAPTNKAASVLRARGVPATTIHRILYTPVYDPAYEKVAEWLAGGGTRPSAGALSDAQLDRAAESFAAHGSVPAALAAAGLRGSDFITGWTRREEPLDIGLVDEASMLDARALDDLRAIFPTLILFGDPAQLPPVQGRGGMVFDALPARARRHLDRIHRQEAGNPILDLAEALADDRVDFAAFEALLREAAARDPRIAVAERADADLMARSPMLVWRNATRIRLIHAWRAAFEAPADALLPGEPLVCDGIELPLRHRRKRIDLEARGLVKGAQVIYLGPGRRPGFSRLHVVGAEEPQVSAASIIRIEAEGEEAPFLPSAAQMGASFVHGAAVTVHKAQGSQWDRVQVFAPDLYAAMRSGRVEDGQPLWKRLAYVAITRTTQDLVWVVRPRLARPERPLGTDDLARPGALALEAEA
ncbi:AAA family ATPase [Rubellimicrobium sp. CFH 75288]|uniref:AAA family ATPase n=1 Tax=Rubellimicrobium sp. CFH 75288 TaxID=2697034 RepID=UPI001411C79C|nr:AAA family ATPase [Rubellimicrobium sp. CFH 75288]NAZ36638.1 AAA family ATPase [Rubellimicrobium sp. CFH 75288]